jgi:hypothetical protein
MIFLLERIDRSMTASYQGFSDTLARPAKSASIVTTM